MEKIFERHLPQPIMWLSFAISGKFAIEVGIPALKLWPRMYKFLKLDLRKLLMSFWVKKVCGSNRNTGKSLLNSSLANWSFFEFFHTSDRAEFFEFEIEKVNFICMSRGGFRGFYVDGDAFL